MPAARSRERIHREGPIPFAAFVEVALYGPRRLLRAAGAAPGRAGRDFVTSPEVGPLFGALVARALDGWWRELERPDPFVVVEAGAGRGRLAADVLAARPACRAGAALRARRAVATRSARSSASGSRSSRSRTRSARPCSSTTTTEADPGHRRGPDRHRRSTSFPAVGVRGVVLANELLDNLPFRVVERTSDGWLEVRVGVSTASGSSRCWCPPRRTLAAEADSWLHGDGRRRRRPAPGADRRARGWMHECARALAPRVVLVVSTTSRRPPSSSRGRPAGWLRTYRDHAPAAPTARRTRARRTSPPTSRRVPRARRPPGRASSSSPTPARPSGCARSASTSSSAEGDARHGTRGRTSATSRRSPAAAASPRPPRSPTPPASAPTASSSSAEAPSAAFATEPASAGARIAWSADAGSPLTGVQSPMSDTIESLLAEGRTFPPPPEFIAHALVRDRAIYDEADADSEAFWARQAAELLDWSTPWHTVLEWDLPFAKWFVGGKLNVSYNCLDRHVEAGHGDQVAYHWEGEPGDARTITYAELLDDVCRLANALKELGVAARATGSTSTSGWCPSCRSRCSPARASAPRTRSCSAGSRPTRCATASTTPRPRCSSPATARGGAGSVVPLKETADAAVAECPSIEKVLVLRRTGHDVPDDRRARRLVARPRAPAVDRVRARAHGRRGPALPALHERHHGEAQGHHAHDRRLPHPGRVDAQVRVRPAPRHRRLLVRGRRRLGHRALVHRLRPAREPRDERDVRGHARLPRQGPALVDRREVRRHDPLHRAHRDPDVHEVGTRVTPSGTTCRRCACSAPSASRSTPRRGSGTGSTSAASAARSSTRGGRPRPAPS